MFMGKLCDDTFGSIRFYEFNQLQYFMIWFNGHYNSVFPFVLPCISLCVSLKDAVFTKKNG